MTARGGAREKNGRFYANTRYGDGERLEFRVPWAKSEDEALARAHVMGEVAEQLVGAGRRDLVRATVRKIAEAATPMRLERVRAAAKAIVDGAIKAGHAKDITFKQWGERYTSGALSKLWPDHVKVKDWSDDVSRLTNYVYKHVGNVPISAFTFEHASLVLSKLPTDKVRREAARRQVAQIMGRLLHLAVFPGRLIPVTPLPRGWLPKVTDRRQYSCLYPREERLLLAHEETSIAFRLFCGILNREGMRLSELLDSTWAQWNLREGTFRTEKTKTHDPRFWAVRPDVAEAMRLWRHHLADGVEDFRRDEQLPPPFAVLLEELPDRTKIADMFRRTLRAAGVDRPELFATTEHTGQLRAHDMRATFVTVSIAEGRPTEWIRDRTAHKSTSMIDRYRRTARQWTELHLGTLPNLVEALGWWKGGGNVAISGPRRGPVSPRKYRRRDSNPHAQRAADFESAQPFRSGPDQLVFPAESDVSLRSEAAFHHLSTTPSGPDCDALGGPSAPSLERSTAPAVPLSRPPKEARVAVQAPARARVEVEGSTVAEVSGTPRQVARGVARGLRRAGLPAVAEGKRVRVGGRS